MNDAFLFSAVRTPVGKFLGALADLPAPALAAPVLAEALRRAGASPAQVEEVLVGHVVQAGVGQNPARQAALRAGLPDTVAALTLNKVCGSGLEAVMQAARAVRAGDVQLALAAGMESMSRAPHLLPGSRAGWKYGDQKLVDALASDGLCCAFEGWPMGRAAEYTAARFGISRGEQDRFAAQSQQRAAAAGAAGLFDAERLPITVGTGPKARTVTADEGPRPETTVDILARLRPSFQDDGTVTAGNASTLADGAAAVLVGSARAAERLGVQPLARVVAYGTAGVAPKDLFIAPALAARQVLDRAGLKLADIDLFEINEAFAAQVLADLKELALDEERVNVHGGAIALGHPIGCSGTRVLVTLLHALARRGARRGLATLCLGGGNAVAMIVERP